MVGQGLEVVALFDSDDVGRAAEATLRTKWLSHYKNTGASTVLLGAALGEAGDVGIEDLISERDYLRKAHEIHATALARAGAKSIAHPRLRNTCRPRRARVCGSRSEIRPASRRQAHLQGVAGAAQNAVPIRHRARNGGQGRALVRLYQRAIFCVTAPPGR